MLSRRRLISDLRKLGGKWKARLVSFGTHAYYGTLNGDEYEVRSYAHMAPQYDGDDETFQTLWHVTRNGEPFGHPSGDPAFMLKEMIDNA